MNKKFLRMLSMAAMLVAGTSAWAYETDGEGKVIIATAQDLVDYANWWNNNPREGKIQGVDAYLTADIDMDGIDFPGIGHDGHENNRFHATLDGRGHRIMNLHMTGHEIALIRVASDNVVIKNLILDKTCSFIGTGRCAAFISACNYPEWGNKKIQIINCGNEAEVKSPDNGKNCAAFLGCNYSTNGLVVEIRNCYNTGNITGKEESAVFSGWLQNCGVVSNCWNTGTVTGADGSNTLYRGASGSNLFSINTNQGATQIAGDQMTSGELCWLLNSTQMETQWYQALGVDAQPMPFGSAVVYKNGEFTCGGDSKGSFSYGNTNASHYDEHQFGMDDLCSACHREGRAGAEVDGYYQIANIGNLVWFADQVNKLGRTTINGALTADIEQGAAEYSPIGSTANVYKGEFDGQGHSITLNLNNPEADYQGIFGVITDGVKIRNLIAKGSIVGHSFVGGIAGGTNGGASNHDWTRLDNCGNLATVEAKGVNAGGMIGVNMNGSASFDINNCYNAGLIKGADSGTMSGWSGGGWSIYRNCFSVNTTGMDFSRNNGTGFSNCYAVAGVNGVNTATDAQFADGTVLALLGNKCPQNSTWKQNIGDAYPTYSGVSYWRAAVADKYSTICLPYAATLSGAQAYIISGKTANGVVLEEVATLEAGKAYIVKAEADGNITAVYSGDKAAAVAADGLVGNYAEDAIDVPTGSYVIKDNTLREVAEGGVAKVAANRAYINLAEVSEVSEVKGILMGFDEATAIQGIESGVASGLIYDLQGRQQKSANASGLYIKNGKKFFVK